MAADNRKREVTSARTVFLAWHCRGDVALVSSGCDKCLQLTPPHGTQLWFLWRSAFLPTWDYKSFLLTRASTCPSGDHCLLLQPEGISRHQQLFSAVVCLLSTQASWTRSTMSPKVPALDHAPYSHISLPQHPTLPSHMFGCPATNQHRVQTAYFPDRRDTHPHYAPQTIREKRQVLHVAS